MRLKYLFLQLGDQALVDLNVSAKLVLLLGSGTTRTATVVLLLLQQGVQPGVLEVWEGASRR